MICASKDFLWTHRIACNSSKNAGAVRGAHGLSSLSTTLSTKINELIFAPGGQKK
jgi:hypothetical protein